MDKEVEAIAYIYQRKKVKEDEGFQSFVYEPVRLTKGHENTYEGESFFITDSGEYIPFIEDVYSIDHELVYAFPYEIEGLSDEEKQQLFKRLKKEAHEASNYILFQIYLEEDSSLTTFATPSEIMANINVDVRDKDGLKKLKNAPKNQMKDIKDIIHTENVNASQQNNRPIIYTDALYESVRQTVICQDEQIKQIATAIVKNQRLQNPKLKSNLLICGPTGVGKTEIFRCISECFNIPILIEDSTEYTAASYKGKDVTEMLSHLIDNADGDLEAAQRGILIVDEIDKKVSSGDHATYTSAVIQSLLKMMEGHTYIIQRKGEDVVQFDTSQLTFAFLGAFSGIEEYMKTKKGMGFNAPVEQTIQNNEEMYNVETLKKYGLLPEFIGRNDAIVVMNSLKQKDLAKIIRESKKSQLLLYKEFYESIGISFEYSEDVILRIAQEAEKLGIGARGIKTIIEKALKVANYYALSSTPAKKLILLPEIIDDPKNYILK